MIKHRSSSATSAVDLSPKSGVFIKRTGIAQHAMPEFSSTAIALNAAIVRGFLKTMQMRSVGVAK